MALRIKTLAFIIAACVGYINAQNLIYHDIEQDGVVYDFDHVFTDPSPLKFVLTDWSVKGEWNVGILNRDGGYDDTEFETENSWCCIFNPNAVVMQLRLSSLLYDDLDGRRFFKVRISFRTHDGIEEHQYVKLKLGPAKPILYDFNFICAYENDDDFRYGYPAEDKNMFSFTAESPNANIITFNLAESDGWPFFGGEDYITYTYMIDYECNNGIVRINDNFMLWGEYIRAYAQNDFGISGWCDPILTTWYINDPDILARIEELRQLSDLNQAKTAKEDPHVIWQHNTVCSNTELQALYVYDMLGSLCGKYHNVSSVDLSHLRRGVYVVAYELSGNQSGKLKIIKQ